MPYLQSPLSNFLPWLLLLKGDEIGKTSVLWLRYLEPWCGLLKIAIAVGISRRPGGVLGKVFN